MEWVVFDMLPDPGPFKGPDGVRRFWGMWSDTFDEFRAEPQEVVETQDFVIVVSRMVGRGKDSGVAVETPSFPIVWTRRDEQVIRVEMLPSKAEALEAAGLPPDTPFEPV